MSCMGVTGMFLIFLFYAKNKYLRRVYIEKGIDIRRAHQGIGSGAGSRYALVRVRRIMNMIQGLISLGSRERIDSKTFRAIAREFLASSTDGAPVSPG